MNCEWKLDGEYCVCQRKGCGLRLKSQHPERCHANCRAVGNPLDCLHLIESTGTNAPINCGGCRTAKGETGIWECDLHGQVTPLARSTDTAYRYCGGCGDWAQK